MSVLLETTLGEIIVDLYTEDCYKFSLNFIKLCKMKFYNFHLIHSIERNFIAQIKSSVGQDSSIWGMCQGKDHNLFKAELKRKHNKKGLISFSTIQYGDQYLASSQFFFTLGDNTSNLDTNACFGEIAEGMNVLQKINMALCDTDKRPFVDIRILHAVVLDDPFEDIPNMIVPPKSPLPTKEMLKTVRLDHLEKLGAQTEEERLAKELQDEMNARALTLEIMGDLPFAEVKPPENVLFVAKLNPITKDDDLKIIFSRFGKLQGCEIVRDKDTGDSMCFAFIEFDAKEACEQAYIKMNNAIIDNRRIHCDFSQSVSKINTYQPDIPKHSIYGQGLQKKTKYRDQGEETKFEFIHDTGKKEKKDVTDWKPKSSRRLHSRKDRNHDDRNRDSRMFHEERNRDDRRSREYDDRHSYDSRGKEFRDTKERYLSRSPGERYKSDRSPRDYKYKSSSRDKRY